MLGVLYSLVNPTLWDLINFLNDTSFTYIDLISSTPYITTDVSEALPSWGGSSIWLVCICLLFYYCSVFEIMLPCICIFLGNFENPRGWILVKPVLWLIYSSKVYHPNGSIFDFLSEVVWWELGGIDWCYRGCLANFASEMSELYFLTLTFRYSDVVSVSGVCLVSFDMCVRKHYFLGFKSNLEISPILFLLFQLSL